MPYNSASEIPNDGYRKHTRAERYECRAALNAGGMRCCKVVVNPSREELDATAIRLVWLAGVAKVPVEQVGVTIPSSSHRNRGGRG